MFTVYDCGRGVRSVHYVATSLWVGRCDVVQAGLRDAWLTGGVC
ncbi:MAG: hypothetical protein ACO2PM_23335 [Pyrobaculum sp.]